MKPAAGSRVGQDGRAERAARAGLDNPRVLFECEKVSVERGGRPVLRDVSLQIDEGATFIAGPSGSGKSTLLRLFNRLADPSSGVVRYRGRDLREYDILALRREVGLVPQQMALIDGTVRENVEYGPKLCGRTADVSRALRLAGLDETFADRRASRLSVGEQQRVMIARALALEPKVLLLDEPTSALDERSKAAVESALLELGRRLGLSIVCVTHDLAQAERMGERLLWVENGHVEDRSGVAS